MGMRTVLVVGLVLVALACEQASPPSPRNPPPARPGPRISMMDLHRSGGVPPGWRFTVPPGDVDAGRDAFADLGCPSCHHVSGEPFSTAPPEGIGPDLTGMGGHHPAEYFAESILDPDAVLVEGPGYIGPDGRSVMPSYPDLTLAQLADLVAYLKSLRGGEGAETIAMAAVKLPPEVPAPPAQSAAIFYVQVYDVGPGRLGDFERWFGEEGGRALLAHEGVVGVDTYVDVTRDGPTVATVIGFRDEASLKRFLDDPEGVAFGEKFDEFIGPHGHRVFRRPPIYRAPTLSAP